MKQKTTEDSVGRNSGRRDLLRAAAQWVIVTAAAAGTPIDAGPVAERGAVGHPIVVKAFA